MKKYILFFDIDGTLLNEEDGTIPNSTIQAIHQARNNGHICIINTGRPISTIPQVIKDIGFDGYICGCGTYIEYHEQVLYHRELSDTLRQELIQLSYTCHIENVLEGLNGAFFKEPIIHPTVQAIYKDYQQSGYPIYIYHQDDNISFDKCAAWYDNTSDINTFKNFLKPHFHIIDRGVGFIEIVPLEVSKATGIQMLIDYLKMSIDQTISIGDSNNDLPMLLYTQESVAMGNANPSLFKQVTYITDTLDNHGILKALQHYHIID